MRFSRQELIRFRHCDPAEIVFYPRYLEIMIDTIEDWFSHMGYPFDQMKSRYSAGIPTVNLNITFSSPCKLGDHLDLELFCKKIGVSSIIVCVIATESNTKVFEADVVLCFSRVGERVEKMAIPSEIRKELEKHLEADQR